MAGGLKPDVYLERAHIMRLMPDLTRQLVQVDLTGMHPIGEPLPSDHLGASGHQRAAGSDGSAPGRPTDLGRPALDPELQEFLR